MLKFLSVFVPCAYSNTGRAPLHPASVPVETIKAPEAVVGSEAPPTVSYSSW
jgi:hypothetical protein